MPGSFAAFPDDSGIFHLESGQIRLESVSHHAAMRYLVFMRFTIRPFLQHFASDRRLVGAVCDGNCVQPYVNGFGDTEAKVFERQRHLGGGFLIAEVFGELFNVADPGISDLATGDLLDGAPGYPTPFGYDRPAPL